MINRGDLLVVGLEIKGPFGHGDIAVHIGQMPQGADPVEGDHLQGLVQHPVEEMMDVWVGHSLIAKHTEIGHAREIVQRADDEFVRVA